MVFHTFNEYSFKALLLKLKYIADCRYFKSVRKRRRMIVSRLEQMNLSPRCVSGSELTIMALWEVDGKSRVCYFICVDFFFFFFSWSIGSWAPMEGEVSRIGRVKTTNLQSSELKAIKYPLLKMFNAILSHLWQRIKCTFSHLNVHE